MGRSYARIPAFRIDHSASGVLTEVRFSLLMIAHEKGVGGGGGGGGGGRTKKTNQTNKQKTHTHAG